jgi:superfamily II DNA or RNA helicase
VPWRAAPRILSEHLRPIPEPLALLLRPGEAAAPAAVAALAARALLDLAPLEQAAWPAWLAPHQIPAAERLAGIIGRYGGALLADAPGLGKSYVALAVALAHGRPITLVVPAVLVPQWRRLLAERGTAGQVITHEALSQSTIRPSAYPPGFVVVDEAHRFRNPDTVRYRNLATLVVGAPLLLVTATPVHNRLGDLFALFRLFLRDHALAGVGVPSLHRAAHGDDTLDAAALAAAAGRLTVARSRARVSAGYRAAPLQFPARCPPEAIRVGTAPDRVLAALVAGIGRLRSGGPAAALFRLTLLRRLASSLPAFFASLERYAAYVDLAIAALGEGRALSAQTFQRLFPRAEDPDLQLALLPLLLEAGPSIAISDDRPLIATLRELRGDHSDPKAAALDQLLHGRTGKTIVFTEAALTARKLARFLGQGHRVAAVFGTAGRFAEVPATRAEVLAAFAPRAQGVAPPAPALDTDVLIATDLLSEGLNLQDAARVVHYDLPWSPARLAQRVGRVDRLGSANAAIETVTFLPPEPVAGALRLEARLVAKARSQRRAGAAAVETVSGDSGDVGALDWCDRLQRFVVPPAATAPVGAWAAIGSIGGGSETVALVIRIGAAVEAVLVEGDEARADPIGAVELLERASTAGSNRPNPELLAAAIRRAAPLVRDRLAALEAARWRAGDRDRLSRRLIPWVLSSARRAARKGDARLLASLDTLVSRLTWGMTAGEERLLEELLERRAPLALRDLLAWHAALPPVEDANRPLEVELIATLVSSSSAPPR